MALRGSIATDGNRLLLLKGLFKELFWILLDFVGPSVAFLGVKGVLEMIVRHRVPSSFNVSSD